MHIKDMFEAQARSGDGSFAIAFAMMEIAEAQGRIAHQLSRIGLGNASTDQGAIELLAGEIKQGLSTLAEVIEARD